MSNTLKQKQQIRKIESFLTSSYEDAQASARWITRQSVELQLWANAQSKDIYFKLVKKHNEDKELLSIIASLSASYKAYDAYQKAHRKNSDFKSDDLTLVNLLELNTFTKKPRVSKKMEYLKRKLPQLMIWRSAGISYREISCRLITPDGETISYEYLRKFFKKQKGINND